MPVLNSVTTIKDLPPTPAGKIGYPWTESSLSKIAKFSLPQITVITPSYNQGQFIEETIRSVLLQGYPNLEYAIIDGGSTDNSVDIIQKYAPFLSYWVSESDNGQSAAINKGFKQTHGEIVAWLNSDDCFTPGILHKIAKIFVNNSDVDLVTCPVNRVTAKGKFICLTNSPATKFQDIFTWEQYMPQAGVFMRRKLLKTVGYLDESLDLQMDYDLWFRCAKVTEFFHFPEIAANIKIHPLAKTKANKYKAMAQAEALAVRLRYANEDIKQQILQNVGNQIIAAQQLQSSVWIRLLKKLKLI